MKKPRLCDYNVKSLIILGNQAYDEVTRDEIRKILVNKLILINYSTTFLLNKFANSSGIIKEVYAELLIYTACSRNLNLSSEILDEIVSLVSMGTLTKYMIQSVSLEIKDKCKNEFWRRALEKEDNVSMIKKKYR